MLPKDLAKLIYSYLNYDNNYKLLLRLDRGLSSNGHRYSPDDIDKIEKLVNKLNLNLERLGLRSRFIVVIITSFQAVWYSFKLKDDKYSFNQNRTKSLLYLLTQVYYVNVINKVIKKYRSKTGIKLIKIGGGGRFKYRYRFNKNKVDIDELIEFLTKSV